MKEHIYLVKNNDPKTSEGAVIGSFTTRYKAEAFIGHAATHDYFGNQFIIMQLPVDDYTEADAKASEVEESKVLNDVIMKNIDKNRNAKNPRHKSNQKANRNQD